MILLCSLCNNGVESLLHLLFECPLVVIAWKESLWAFCPLSVRMDSMLDWIRVIIMPEVFLGLPISHSLHFTRLAAILMDIIWFVRNQVVHKGVQIDSLAITLRMKRMFLEHSEAWKLAQAANLDRWSFPPCWLLQNEV